MTVTSRRSGAKHSAMSAGRVIAVLAATIVTLFFSVTANATDAADSITWSVSPANETGPDGRNWAEFELDPGETVTDHLAIRNLSDTTADFDLSAADGYFTATGRFNMYGPDKESTDAGTWIEMQETVTVPAGEVVVVPFTLTVPTNAEAGDHAAGVAASVVSTAIDADGKELSVLSRFGFRVMIKVSGDLLPDYRVDDIAVSSTTSWNPFRPGNATLSFNITNAGNLRLSVGGTVSGAGQTIPIEPKADASIELLPGDTRRVEVPIEDVWPLFRIPFDVNVAPEAVLREGAPSIAVPTTQETAVLWAIPWSQLVLLVGVCLILVGVFGVGSATKRRFNRKLENAYAEGLKEASMKQMAQSTPDTSDAVD